MIIKNAFKFRAFNSGGPGGQHCNTTNNAIEVTLSNEAAKCLGIDIVSATATLKSQHASKRAVLRAIRAKIQAMVIEGDLSRCIDDRRMAMAGYKNK